jgi:NAD(P)-dependent dehydrogenase (short-subunit alcohol dehydrogenase family)
VNELEGRVAVVTGGASGIGFGMAQRFGREGARVVLADIEQVALDRAVAELQTEGIEAIGHRTDVSSEADVMALADTTMSRFGAVHILANNAGVESGGWFSDIPMDTWAWVMNVNFYGVLHGCRAFLPHLSAQDRAHIVNTASVAAFATGAPAMTPYCVSKFAVLSLSECLEIELRSKESTVGVSVLVPGPTKTRMMDSERNRPTDVPALSPDSVQQALTARAAEFIEREGMDPLETADYVLAAIRNRQFYVLTHPTLAMEGIDRRVRWMTENIPPAPRGF